MSEEKEIQIFRELVGDKANRLRGDTYLADVTTRVMEALVAENPECSVDEVISDDNIAHNLIDWQSDAAFIVALSLFPDRFTDEEIQEGVRGLLLHVPNHVVRAAKLAGYYVDGMKEED